MPHGVATMRNDDEKVQEQSDYESLESSFQEYIAKSKEYELEMDEELANLQHDLNESYVVNEDLVGQLEKMGQDMMKLELAYDGCKQKLSEERTSRREAEQAQDIAEEKVHELQSELRTLKEENDRMTEEAAFKEEEMEEKVLEMEIEKEQIREELEDLKADVFAADHAAQNNKVHVIVDEEERKDEEKEEMKQQLQAVTEKLESTEAKLKVSQDRLCEVNATVDALLGAERKREGEILKQEELKKQQQLQQQEQEDLQIQLQRQEQEQERQEQQEQQELQLQEEVRREMQQSLREEIIENYELVQNICNGNGQKEIHDVDKKNEVLRLQEELEKNET